MLASATASMLSRIPCHPLDTIKAKLQVGARGGLWGVLRHTLRTEGLRGLYRGFGAAFVGSGPAGCLYFTTYELAKKGLLSVGPVGQSPFLAHFGAGLLAELVSCALWVPIDVVKERMQVQSTLAAGKPSYAYTGDLHAAATILRTEGLRGLYRGYGATVLSFGPFSALYFVYYEQLKGLAEAFSTSASTKRPPPEGSTTTPLSFGAVLACSATAASLAALCTNVLDMAKLRMQVERAGGERTFGYTNVFHGVARIVSDEGWRGIFRGAGARIAFQAPTTAIALAAFERLKVGFGHLADHVPRPRK